ncbi:6306_t:CDS:2 [Paraglomus brasilianum]|uniref:6306_t:CDS:1 n=1 Tax=Paraglomus brasilianum TaxID=144538 RepID=A0A9N8VZ93_9GLOM|nr:6306_t:CDS:2 [Paraglomus brasilianum]
MYIQKLYVHFYTSPFIRCEKALDNFYDSTKSKEELKKRLRRITKKRAKRQRREREEEEDDDKEEQEMKIKMTDDDESVEVTPASSEENDTDYQQT